MRRRFLGSSHHRRDAEISLVNQQAAVRVGASALVDYFAYNPVEGDLIPGTGGIRTLRSALEGRGKRGGARVICFYHDEDMPLFLLTAHIKNERADLSQKDRNDFKQLTTVLV